MIGSLIAVPLIRQGEVLGLIYVDAVGRANVFKREHLLVMDLATRLVAVVSDNQVVARK